MADDEYNQKLESLQQYIPFLNNMIMQLKDPRKKVREQQLTKIVSLHSMITDRKKKLKLETLIKCEDVILKLQEKVKFGSQTPVPITRPEPVPPPVSAASVPYSPFTPSSPSPPRDIPKTKPVVIPTEKVVNRDSKLETSSSSYKQKIDVYSSAADSLKSLSKPKTPDVFHTVAPDMSKPPISLEDLEALQADNGVDCDQMSLNELTELKQQLEKQLSTQVEELANKPKAPLNSASKTQPVNPTARKTTILTKKSLEKETSNSSSSRQKSDSTTDVNNDAKPVTSIKTPSTSKQVKVIKESDSIFGSTLSSIDNKILESASSKTKDHKERRNSGSSAEKLKEKERRISKDDKKGDSSICKDNKDKTDKKNAGNNELRSTGDSEKKTSDHKHHKDDKKNVQKKPVETKSKDTKTDDHKKQDVLKKDNEKKIEHVNKIDAKVNNEKDKMNKIDSKSKSVEVQPKQEDTPPKVESKPKSEGPIYKRLADKYNPKPRKPSVETTTTKVESPKKVEPAPVSSITEGTVHKNLTLDLKPRPASPVKPSIPKNSINIPLLSPSCSVSSADTEISAINKNIPQPISNLLMNPQTTEIINAVVNQFKGRQTPLPLNTPNGFPQHQANFSFGNEIGGPQFPNQPLNQNQQFVNNFPNNNWGNQPQQPHQHPPIQNFHQRTLLPLMSCETQKPMQHHHQEYFPPRRSSTPAPFPINNHNQPPQRLSPKFDRFERSHNLKSNVDETHFNTREHDNRYGPGREPDRRRDGKWPQRDSRDPRLHREPRSYREDPRTFRREKDFGRERDKEWDRDDRSSYSRGREEARRPQSRYEIERERDCTRSRSVSRDKDESFVSPLDSLYSGGERKTGKGYGVQQYKMRHKVKREAEEDKPLPVKDNENDKKPIVEEIAAESLTVTSSTEFFMKKEPSEKEKSIESHNEITSTNEVTTPESEDSKPKESDQTEIINKFLKQLLENEATRNAAAAFIDNVSNSVDDENLKMIVQTVKSASKPEEGGDLDKSENEARSTLILKTKRNKSELLRRRRLKLQKLKLMRKKMLLKKKKNAAASKASTSKESSTKSPGKKNDKKKEDDKDKEGKDEEEAENAEGVVVSVGERIKSRRRVPQKKKRIRHRTELDLLREDIHEMFIRDGVLTATGKRMCSILRKDAAEPPKPEPKKRTRSTTGKSDTNLLLNDDKLKAMSNVRVLIPKISVENLEVDEDGKRYSLRNINKAAKIYVENSDDEKESEKKKESLRRNTRSKNYNEESDDESNSKKIDAKNNDKVKEIESEQESEEENKKDVPTKKQVHRKRSKAWASGILPKTKRKRKETLKEEEEEKTHDESLDLIEPDKNYFTANLHYFRMPCKLCEFHGKYITIHYKREHPESEVLSSRLSPKTADIVIKQSIYLKLDQNPEEKLSSSKKQDFVCRFCKVKFKVKPTAFYEHLSTHTGEYRHSCTLCSFTAPNYKAIRIHGNKTHGKIEFESKKIERTKIYGYICTECNYVQMNKKAVESHVNIYHLGEGNKILRIHLNSLEPSRRSKPVEANESNAVDDESESADNADDSMEVEEDADLEEEQEEEENVDDKPLSKRQKISQEDSLEVKNKEIDMTVFTCKTNLDEENEKIEQERLKKMTELNESVKTSKRQSLNFIEQLSNRLMQEKEDAPSTVAVKEEPMDLDDIIERQPELVSQIIQKPTKTIEETSATTSSSYLEVSQKNNPFISCMIEKLQGILKEEKKDEGPPPLTPLEKPKELSTVLSAGFLNIVKDDDGIEYACRVPSCLFVSKSRDQFLTHWSEDHSRVNQAFKSTKCRICSCDINATFTSPLLTNFFIHVEEEHLNRPVQKTILRTRRLSGDKLSIPKEEKPDTPPPAELDLPQEPQEDAVSFAPLEEATSEDNPFPFKISGVMSLAEDPVPPLSPLREKPPVRYESVILKETKMTSAEKKLQWKSIDALNEFIQCPTKLYKCPQYLCKFATNWRQIFDNHIKSHVSVNDELVACVYCSIKTPLSGAGLHIDLRHSNCLYSCSQCCYRALTVEYVLVHMKSKHRDSDVIIELPPKASKTQAILANPPKFSVKEACPPYVCGYRDCRKEFLFEDEFKFHSERAHDVLSQCGHRQSNCDYKFRDVEDMIDHWIEHGVSRYHCLVCKMGCMEIYTMLQHYATVHANMEPIAVDRFKGPGVTKLKSAKGTMYYTHYTDEAFKSIKQISKQVLDSVNTQGYRLVKAAPVQESINADETPEIPQPLKVVPFSIVKKSGKKFIAILPKPSRKLPQKQQIKVKMPSSVISLKNQQLSVKAEQLPQLLTPEVNNDIAESSVIPSVQEQLCESNFVEVADEDSKEKDKDQDQLDTSDLSMVDPLSIEDGDSQDFNETGDLKNFGLIGYQLYRCAFCDISFSNSKGFKRHCSMSKMCQDNDTPGKPFRCVHCKKQFKLAHGLMEHMQYHGQLRFLCSLCCKKFPSTFSLKTHMRFRHNVSYTITTPLIPNRTDLERDEFVLRPKPVGETEQPGEGPNYSTSPHKSVYSPAEIETLPQRYIFSSDVRCSVCSYATKVRTNLIRHLQLHLDEKSVPDTAPVNPVPCLDKNEKMFDKMTNLAISSFAGTGRMGGAGSKTKTETAVEDQVDVVIPAYVPSNRRYVCCVENCSYLCLEESNLRHHLFALHCQESVFTCAHCATILKTDIDGCLKHLKLHDLHLYKCQICSYVHNLRHKVDKHCKDKHPDQLVKTVTVRALESETLEIPTSAELNQSSDLNQTSDDNSNPGTSQNVKWTKPWHCGMCKYKCANRTDIASHVLNKHNIDSQYKCTLCTHKTDEKESFGDHFKDYHPDNDIDIIEVYYKSEGTSKTKTKTSLAEKQFDTTPLWQRDRPRVRHIRGILFEESPQKMKKSTVLSTKIPNPIASTSTSNSSNIDLAIDAVVKGIDNTSSSQKGNGTNNVNEQGEMVVIVDDEESGDLDVVDGDSNIDKNDSGEISLTIDDLMKELPIKTEDNKEYLSSEVLMQRYGKLISPASKAFKCPLCTKFLTRRISCFVHHVLTEMKVFRFRCRSCEFACLTLDAMGTHCQQEHDGSIADNIEDLPIEKPVEFWLQLLLRHQARALTSQIHSPPQGLNEMTNTHKILCEYCEKWFKNVHLLKEHELYHWAEHNYICVHCLQEFGSLDEIFQHNFLVHPTFDWSIKIAGPQVSKVIASLKLPPNAPSTQMATAASVPSPSTNTSEENLYSCSICSESERSVDLLKKHFSEIHPNEQFKYKEMLKLVCYCCKYCHMRETKDNLLKHHNKEHPKLAFSVYQMICLECSGTFMNLREMKTHFNKCHSNKKFTYTCIENKPCANPKDQLTCTKCPFRCNTIGGIRVHLRKHLRPIDCLICGATFIYPTEARAHHNKEHIHSSERIEENAERLREYEESVQAIVAARGSFVQPQKKMLARKSTGAPFTR